MPWAFDRSSQPYSRAKARRNAWVVFPYNNVRAVGTWQPSIVAYLKAGTFVSPYKTSHFDIPTACLPARSALLPFQRKLLPWTSSFSPCTQCITSFSKKITPMNSSFSPCTQCITPYSKKITPMNAVHFLPARSALLPFTKKVIRIHIQMTKTKIRWYYCKMKRHYLITDSHLGNR